MSRSHSLVGLHVSDVGGSWGLLRRVGGGCHLVRELHENQARNADLCLQVQRSLGTCRGDTQYIGGGSREASVRARARFLADQQTVLRAGPVSGGADRLLFDSEN